MRQRGLSFVPVLLLAAWGPVWSGGASDAPASTLQMPEPAFQRPVVEVAESHPVQFALVFEQKMPTPGWTSKVDSVDVDGEAGRIVVEITQQAPEGIVAQVITPTRLRVPLGSIPRGRYVLELRVRRDGAGGYQPVHALVVSAS